MELLITTVTPSAIQNYFADVKNALTAIDGLTLLSAPAELTYLQIPVSSERALEVVNKLIPNYANYKFNYSTPSPHRPVSYKQDSIHISYNERTWHQILEMQMQVLDALDDFLVGREPTEEEKGYHNSPKPLGYIKKYGTVSVLRWWSGAIPIVNADNRQTLIAAHKLITDKHPLEISFKPQFQVKIA